MRKGLSVLDKINSGVPILAVIFTIFRKQFDYLNTAETQKIVIHLKKHVHCLNQNSSLEEIAEYLQALPHKDFFSLIEQLVATAQDSKLNVKVPS